MGGGGCGIQLDESIIHVTVSHINDFTIYLTTRTQVQSHSYAHEYKKNKHYNPPPTEYETISSAYITKYSV